MSTTPITLKVRKLHPLALLPVYATAGAACFDLHAIVEATQHVAPGCTLTVDTGLAFEVPAGHVMLIFSRSGHGFNFDVRLGNCVGVIDSDYRGAIKVKLKSDGDEYLSVCTGDRIAQAMIVPLPTVSLEWADSLSTTERGAGGFGSTGS